MYIEEAKNVRGYALIDFKFHVIKHCLIILSNC